MVVTTLYIICIVTAFVLLVVAIAMIALQTYKQNKSCIELRRGTAETLITMQEAHEATLTSLRAISDLLHFLVDSDAAQQGVQDKTYDKITRMEYQMRDIQEAVDELHANAMKQTQELSELEK